MRSPEVSNGAPATTVRTRGYQQEMLDESLRMNLVIALDTGSGKTHIAVLRMKLESERELSKVSWFLAPTVALVEQQSEVIKSAIPVSVTAISGASEPKQWIDPKLWRSVLDTHRVIVSTPQILLDALHHGYIDLGRDIGLLIFDEAHHAMSKHPYNMIMQNFYFSLPPRSECVNTNGRMRPMVLGLTASPIYGGNVDASFHALERNLDSTIRSSRMHREELAQYVHRPVFKHIFYDCPPYLEDEIPSANYQALQSVVDLMKIEDDPYVKSLRNQLKRANPGDEWRRIDQQLSKTIRKEDTFCHKGLRDFARAAQDIGLELGPWAADWYVLEVIEQAQRAADPYNNIMASWGNTEKRYLLDTLAKVKPIKVPFDENALFSGLSSKVWTLANCLVAEEKEFRSQNESYSGLVFVTRRDTVLALAEVLRRLPQTGQLFRIGCLVGSSSSFSRHAFLDITRQLVIDSHLDTLAEFRSGEKNLIISTSVAEEGIDIQACGSVIRFDLPPNTVSWAQSRGRARKSRSSFVLMFENGAEQRQKVEEWEQTEYKMMTLYNDPNRISGAVFEEDDDEEVDLQYVVPSTGAILTLHSATSHLNHFCAVLPNSAYQYAAYDLDPPDFPEDWHSKQDEEKGIPVYQGPWGATITLPRALPKHLRTFTTPREHRTKRSAQRHVAFQAYVELHKAGLLNDHLLPLTSAMEPDQGEEVKQLLAEIEKRAGMEQVSIQMDPWAPETNSHGWWRAELVIASLPKLYILTRDTLPPLSDEESPTLHLPGRGSVKVRIQPLGRFDGGSDYIERAREYTRRLFFTLYGSHTDPDKTDFSYLFLPAQENKDEPGWEKRRKWMKRRLERAVATRLETAERANVEAFNKQFGFPTDLSLIRSNERFGKFRRFVRWRYELLTEEEEEELRERYESHPDIRITYPLLEVQAFPQRANFLIPLAAPSEGLPNEESIFLLPSLATVELVSNQDVYFAMYLPSVLRALANVLTVVSLRETLLAGSPVSQAPFSLLTTAVTAPVSQELSNYQRLETLGDTVLKYVTTIQLFADHPLWHEGYLARRKDHAVSNIQLAKQAISKRLYQWIIRDRFVPRKWRPHYITDVDVQNVSTEETIPLDDKKKKTQALSTKVLADVVESLIGAAYEHGGFDLAVDCTSIFGMGLTWKKIPVHIENILAITEELENPPPQLALVERMIGYQFSRKALLVQALTHASYHGDTASMSYERLEFLGDSALDMIVTDFLYHAPGKNYKPGHMHIRKEALVNSHFLAFICLRTHTDVDGISHRWTPAEGVTTTPDRQTIHLYQCLLHSSHRVLDDQNVAFGRYKRGGQDIQDALDRDAIYPWAALTSLQSPKFVSDMVESLLGAVFVDAAGDLGAVRGVLRTLGVVGIMERIVADDVDVQHPISRLTIWADKQEPKRKAKLEVTRADGNVSCAVLVDGSEVVEVTEVYRSRASQEEVRFAAAEKAIKILNVIEDDDDWGDPLEYDW
ncbi:uncharacterized protein FIBRA_08535 [Fibroporia radiculosa]|uniref:Dicer-like protein 2 n=1 Tax=Fibroporia radiculosa TaxID=599839 RepID=J4H582_9APHY|nr:uncharacterized protein FIBRA_08535 [Fibroporia radiculosa]CCM06284.1 predicted protein [Fibroporia radiculosa]